MPLEGRLYIRPAVFKQFCIVDVESRIPVAARKSSLSSGADMNVFLNAITIWVLSLLSVTVWLALQLYDNIHTYLMYPTIVSRRIVSPGSMAFPAVTLCNVNPLRTRSLFAMEEGDHASPTVYEAITEYYRLINPSPDTSDGQTDIRTKRFLEVLGPYLDRISPRDLYTAASHKAEAFIHRCEWRNERCGPDDFTPTLTDAGLCYIFNQNASLHTEISDFL
ncbi:acid-sensing ion channel 1A-like [Haliotis rufescens]|uniref:acid-sensing ion channel 1A-like n=1 Tax=Haliotis rufescens TaxID=6454 RepID=UPI00201F81DE|nr:acid-sensing ion channel 1A-like [Haliotis rufescens]